MMYQRSTQRGMTLVEMLVSIGLYTILLGIVFGGAQLFYQRQGQGASQADEVDYARRAITSLTQDLREMTYSENGSFPVMEIDDHRIGFYSDIDKDNGVEFVRYELESGSTDFYKRVYNPVGYPPVYDLSTPDEEILLSRFVQNRAQSTSTFLSYDSDHNQLTSGAQLPDVRFILGRVIVNVDPVRSPGEFLLQTAVAPRNLKDNL